MNVFFISDLHLGHKNILKYSGDFRQGSSIEEHDMWLVDQWNSVVTKKDIVYVLGDVSFDKKKLLLLKKMQGQKNLVRGNHDTFSLQLYAQYFNNIYGLLYKYGYWLSHAPVHELSLRNRLNIHGHLHQNRINDARYINVCVEQLNGVPISLDEVNEIAALSS